MENNERFRNELASKLLDVLPPDKLREVSIYEIVATSKTTCPTEYCELPSIAIVLLF